MNQDDLKQLMRLNYLQYASYVILDRAIPDAVDGLKPVQRRILHTLFSIDDGKLHKVANIVGQTMALHPHGDAPINEALINIANKGYLIDRQGNFGNLFTGDPAAAARYIEARLSPLARETIFNPSVTAFTPSYDGRKQEPVRLPVKIPLLLMQGAEGIAVGMATKILPHNFKELLEAEIAYLQKKPFELLPDFPTGGIMDASNYEKGKGKIKLRVKLEFPDNKTILIKETCYGTTTESLINSIDEAAKKGRIKVESINDYTAEKVEIEIKLPRGQYAASILDALYAFTECEISISANALAIHEGLPIETNVDELLTIHTDFLKKTLRKELELERDHLIEKIFEKTLEQIFIENKIYQKIENIKTLDGIHDVIEKGLKPFHKQLSRIPTHEDRERLLSIPIRRISRFDIDKNESDIQKFEGLLVGAEKNLKTLTRYTIQYIKSILKKFGSDFDRKTKIQEIEQIDIKSVSKKKIQVGVDLKNGFVGSKVKGEQTISCTNLDKILIFFTNGMFKVIPPPEKEYVLPKGSKISFIGVADKKTLFRVLYSNTKKHHLFSKRFIVKKFILGKVYHYFDQDNNLELITTVEGGSVKVQFKPKAKQKIKTIIYDLDDVAIKGVSAKGIRIATKEIKKIVPIFEEDSPID